MYEVFGGVTMQIPFSFLLEHLNSSPDLRIFAPQETDFLLSRPRFLLPGQVPKSGTLYISDHHTLEEIPNFPPNAAGLATSEPPLLLNQVQELYDQCEHWSQTLSASVDAGEIRDLLDEMETILGNPVLLRRSTFAIVGCSGEIFSNPQLSGLRGSHLSYEYVNALKRDPQYTAHETTKEPFFFAIPGTKDPALGVNLFPDGQSSYRLTVLPALRPITDGDRFLLTLCAEAACQILQRTVIGSRFADPTGRKERLVELFRTAVENDHADQTVLEQGFSALGWLPSHQYCCLSIRVGALDYLNQTVDLLCNQLETTLPFSCVFPRVDAIAVLVNLTQADSSIRALLDQSIYFFRDNDLRTGISNTFTGFQYLHSYYKQAIIALGYASRPQAFLWTQYFSDVVLEYILEQSNRELPLQLVCSQKILQIRQYDKKHQTDFYVTLEAYIQNKFNAVQTAKELQIHRSTFLYRMERLQALFDLDLTHRDSLLYVLLSMRMLELSKSMTMHEAI